MLIVMSHVLKCPNSPLVNRLLTRARFAAQALEKGGGFQASLQVIRERIVKQALSL